MRKATQKTQRIASKSANCMHNALGYLEAALGELEEAGAWTQGEGHFIDRREVELAQALRAILEASGGPSRSAITELRDRRAALAGFNFDYLKD